MLLSILFQFYIARAISARLPMADLDVFCMGVGSRFLDQIKILQGLGKAGSGGQLTPVKFGVEVRN